MTTSGSFNVLGNDGRCSIIRVKIVENDLVKATDAYKNNRIVCLENPNVWYTAEGGRQALGIMLQDLENGLGIN